MEAFRSVTGVAAPMPAANIDTDVIMPKVFLKGVDRLGLAEGVFHDLRFNADGAPASDFILNQPAWRETAFLIVGPNFGCGSSREHAVWGLRQLGIRALVGTTFAGIFFDNCARNGVLALSLQPDRISQLTGLASDASTNLMTINLVDQHITAGALRWSFEVDALLKAALVAGLDQVGSTLGRSEAIRAFEETHFASNPWLRAQGGTTQATR